MKAWSRTAVLAALLTALAGCSVTVESRSDTHITPHDRAVAICGMGVLQTPTGVQPALAEMHLPPQAYQAYVDCVEKITAREQGEEK
jgi:hypothetical protein